MAIDNRRFAPSTNSIRKGSPGKLGSRTALVGDNNGPFEDTQGIVLVTRKSQWF
jgi:hypothetical protein